MDEKIDKQQLIEMLLSKACEQHCSTDVDYKNELVYFYFEDGHRLSIEFEEWYALIDLATVILSVNNQILEDIDGKKAEEN